MNSLILQVLFTQSNDNFQEKIGRYTPMKREKTPPLRGR